MIKSNKLCKSSTPNSSKTEFLLTGLSKQLVKTHNSSLNTIHSAGNLGFTSDKSHLIRNRPYLCPNPAITIFVNFAVSIHTSIPKQILPLPLFTPSLNTAILSITTSQSLKSRASNRSTTLMLLSKPPNPFISLPSHTLCTGFDNVVLYGAPMTTINKLQRVHNNAAKIVLQMPKRTHAKPLLEKLHCLPIEQRIRYKTAVLTFKVQSTSTTAYLNHHIQICRRAQDTRSSATPELFEPFTMTNYVKRATRCLAPAV